VLNRDDSQIVFVDTPGVGKPRSALGRRLNATATDASSGVDVICFVFDARSGYGRGDAFLAEKLDPARTVVVANKIDNLGREAIAKQLMAVSSLDASAYFPVSAQTGDGVDALIAHLAARMPPGPHWYPPGQITDQSETGWVAELVREQLLRATHDEVPHSVATRVVEWEPPYVRVEILVERESQKAIVIGRGGEMLKEVGERARRRLPPNTYLELFVTVDKNWHHDPDRIEELGY
jgi:GTP-binding protein Era